MKSAFLLLCILGLFGCQAAEEPAHSDSVPANPAPAQRDFAPAYSPDGVYIAFYSYREEGDHGDIYLLNRENGDLRRLTVDPTYDIEPKWSPDSREIAYVVSEDMRVLQTAFVDINGNPTRERIDGGINTWGQDGDQVAVNKRQDHGFVAELVSLGFGTRHAVQSPEGAGFVGPWTPDLQMALYTRATDTGQDLFVFDANTKASHRLTTGFEVQYQAWSHAGTDVCFVGMRDEQADLFIVRADGAGLRQLTDSPETESMCAWSPTGQHIAYSRPEGQAIVLYEISLETGDVRQLIE